jgi:hypothetical protein
MLTSTTSRDPLGARAQIEYAMLADIHPLAIGTILGDWGRSALECNPLNFHRAKALRRKMSTGQDAKQRQQFVALEIKTARIFEHGTSF